MYNNQFMLNLSFLLSDLVHTEYLSEWQAGFIYGYAKSKESEVKNGKNAKNAECGK